MQNVSALGTVDTGPLAGKADQLIRQSASSIENKKIDKSAKDFESILLGSWLHRRSRPLPRFLAVTMKTQIPARTSLWAWPCSNWGPP